MSRMTPRTIVSDQEKHRTQEDKRIEALGKQEKTDIMSAMWSCG